MPEENQASDKPARKPTPPAATASPSETKTPKEWAMLTGNGPSTEKRKNAWKGPGFSRPHGSVEHEAAELLHGWGDHKHETGAPIQLTRADYEAALAATHPEDEYELTAGPEGKPVPKADEFGNPVIKKHAGNPVPHPAALSPYKGKRGQLRIGEKPVADGAKS